MLANCSEHLHDFVVRQVCDNVALVFLFLFGKQDVAQNIRFSIENYGTKIDSRAHENDKFRSNLCISRCSLKISSAD